MRSPETDRTSVKFETSDLPDIPQDVHVLAERDIRSGPLLTPQQYIHFYDGVEWEQFIWEWAKGLNQYLDVKRLGGANDRGVDIAGFHTPQGVDGSWDCFQCKHYKDPLAPSELWPEIVKLLIGVIGGHYTLPKAYVILAPKECGSKLERLLSSPSKLKSEFIKQINLGRLTADLSEGEVHELHTFIASVDFSMFRSADMADVISVHSRTRYHATRFGTALPSRPADKTPPEEPHSAEARFVQQLMQVYSERYGLSDLTPEAAKSHEDTAVHFRRQRVYFYSAETLRLFARDSVPPGTYESMQEDVFHGVIEAAERSYPLGYDRLTEVLDASTRIQMTGNILLTRSNLPDRKGMCHQLANEDRLTWLKDA